MPPRRRLRSALLAVPALLVSAGPLLAQVAGSEAGDTSGVERRALQTALLLTGAYLGAGFVVMDHVWYRDQERVPFHFFNDNAAYLQIDKFGHAFGAYALSHVGYGVLRRTGLTRKQAVVYGGAFGLILQTPIEIMDGIHEGWGFSWGDMAANAIGSGLVVGQELLFREQLVRYKFSYSPTGYAELANGYLGTTTLQRLLEDYNGHTYWLSVPLARLARLQRVPQWLNVAVGYGANGMIGEFANITEYDGVPIPETTRYRQYLLSLDIDWTRIPTRSPLLKMVFTGLTFVKLPFPAVELRSNAGIRGHLLYY